MDPIRISAPSFLDYMHSTSRGCIKIVKSQRKMYLDPESRGYAFYQPIRTAIRRAFNSVEPTQELGKVVDKADAMRYPHFVELEAGFARWWRKITATGVRVNDTTWRGGDLVVGLANLVGLRYRDGSTEVVLPYLKEAALTSEAANPILLIMEQKMAHLLPGARPMILDVRRGKAFRFRRNTNRDDLRAFLSAEVAKYTTHWRLAA